MPNYDFLTLSPYEFEELSIDILRKHRGVWFESFMEGKDMGIDFRGTTHNGLKIIGQCKRYKDYGDLIANLKREYQKAKNLDCDIYIVSTSVELNPNRKNEILGIFEGKIKSSEDIFGRNELNSLLGDFEDIERKHFKLWLASTNVLERIINAKIYNQTKFEEEKIKEALRLYVPNDSFNHGLRILKESHFIIVSGLPGVGKTTLAYVLVFYFLAKGYDEFILLSDSINEGFSSFHSAKRQVFLFDDFLGRNFLHKKLNTNEEKNILKFIEKVRNSSDKILIFTTREYILRQARIVYEDINNPLFELSKKILDLSEYTNLVKARILYNHLTFSKLPNEFISEIATGKKYWLIIKHKNYNPRLIEFITKDTFWKGKTPNGFFKEIISSLDNPSEVWKHAFENQINGNSQILLSILLTLGNPILLDDLLLSFSSFAEDYHSKYGLVYSKLEFMKSISELENTFILIQKDTKDQLIVELKNPSIHDFLVHHFRNESDLVKDLIRSSIFYEQLFHVYTCSEYIIHDGKKYKTSGQILLDMLQKKILIDKIINDFDNLDSCTLKAFNDPYPNMIYWRKRLIGVYFKLFNILKFLGQGNYPNLSKAIFERFTLLLFPDQLMEEEFDYYISLISIFKHDLGVYPADIIRHLFSLANSLTEISFLIKIREIYPSEFDLLIESEKTLPERMFDIMYEDASDAFGDSLEDILNEIEDIGVLLNIETKEIVTMIEGRIAEETEKEDDDGPDWYESGDYTGNSFRNIQSENDAIDIMFSGFQD